MYLRGGGYLLAGPRWQVPCCYSRSQGREAVGMLFHTQDPRLEVMDYPTLHMLFKHTDPVPVHRHCLCV